VPGDHDEGPPAHGHQQVRRQDARHDGPPVRRPAGPHVPRRDVLLLTHTGRTSGRTYTTPALYVRDGEDYVVAASNGGIDREPQWWLNLQADPRGAVEIGGRRTDVVASTVGDRDRQRLWDALMAKCPTYDDYQASVSRRISLVRLSPVAEEQAA
jgi:F420H(2)-dependent quinone reductase